jgi:hypothetical protein
MQSSIRPPLNFRKALRRAIFGAWRQGKITSAEAYVLLDVLHGSQRGGRYYKKPQMMIEAENYCRKELLIYDAESAETGDIDWGNWIDLLIEWLPAILKIFLLLLGIMEPPPHEPAGLTDRVPPFVK